MIEFLRCFVDSDTLRKQLLFLLFETIIEIPCINVDLLAVHRRQRRNIGGVIYERFGDVDWPTTDQDAI